MKKPLCTCAYHRENTLMYAEIVDLIESAALKAAADPALRAKLYAAVLEAVDAMMPNGLSKTLVESIIQQVLGGA
jgi:hypothetical protein